MVKRTSASHRSANEYELRIRRWDVSLAGRINPNLSETVDCQSLCRNIWNAASFKEILWHEMCSEYDARRLAEHLRKSRVELSKEYRYFQRAWLRDENHHYLGFRHLYSTMYDVSSVALARLVRARASGFSGLSPFLENEFRLCVLLAYDEMVTARAYAADFPIYDSLGDKRLSMWIRGVCRDESLHCRNMVELLRLRYPVQLQDIPPMLDELASFDSGAEEYTGTFVLDHQHFPASLLNGARSAVLKLCRI